MHCAERFILNTHPTLCAPESKRVSRVSISGPGTSASRWTILRDKAEFVIGHPNGWEGPQQAKMRQAAIRARLIPDTPEGMNRLRFVTEGEASLCYCLGEIKESGLGNVSDDNNYRTKEYYKRSKAG